MEKVITHQQFLLTAAYAFMDYRSQGQTTGKVIVDISQSPVGKLIPFNMYISLSWSQGRDSIRLLRGFDEQPFTMHPNEHL